MLYSMTGYGRHSFENDQIKIDVEIKSLNSKNFDLNLKFYDIPQDKEIQLRKFLSEKLKRGKVFCSVQWELKLLSNKYTIKEQALLGYYQQMKQITEKIGEKPQDIYSLIIGFPDLLEAQEVELDKYWSYFLNAIEIATEKLSEFRKQEGQATEKDILQKLQIIENLLPQIEQFENQRNENFRKRLLEALQKNNIEADKERFEQELLYYLDKYDINEEKKRLKNHIQYFKQVSDNQDIEKGKKLTFIAQEMGREINTLGNKSYYFEIQRIVVEMKDNLEKIKEQLANIL